MKNKLIFAQFFVINKDEKYWKNPEEFNPNRFLDDSGHFMATKFASFVTFGN